MIKTVLQRLVVLVPTVLFVSVIVFSLVLLVPGDTATKLAGENATAEDIARIREATGLDQPLYVQYTSWLGDAVQGDFGRSLFTGQPVAESVFARLPTTLSLTFFTLSWAVLAGVLLGALAGTRPHGLVDRVVTIGASVGVAVPTFWLGMLLILGFAIEVPWFPAVGYTPLTADPVEWAKHLVLPSLALGASVTAEIARQTRGGMVDIMDQDYVRTARAKGLRPSRVIGKHALKNAAIPVVTVVGLQAQRLIGGTVVTERIFGMPGIGNYAYDSVVQRDIRAVQAVVVIAVLMVLLINLLVDISYSYFSPRTRNA